MAINYEIDFNSIVSDILKNSEFIELKYEKHHGITRLDHSLNVAHITYKLCKGLKVLNIKEITRAALLHDFFKDTEICNNAFVEHPMIALKNASKYFSLSDEQKNMIASHMFPVSRVLPKTKGSWLISIADKFVALKEMVFYKAPLYIGTAYLFIFNFCMISR